MATAGVESSELLTERTSDSKITWSEFRCVCVGGERNKQKSANDAMLLSILSAPGEVGVAVRRCGLLGVYTVKFGCSWSWSCDTVSRVCSVCRECRGSAPSAHIERSGESSQAVTLTLGSIFKIYTAFETKFIKHIKIINCRRAS